MFRSKTDFFCRINVSKTEAEISVSNTTGYSLTGQKKNPTMVYYYLLKS